MNGQWLRRPGFGVTVVFVHGATTSDEACWSNPNGAYWPALVRDDDSFGDVGVYVFSDRKDIFSRNYLLDDAVRALHSHLHRDAVVECQTLVFVAHSTGGLVVRKYLVDHADDIRDRRLSIGVLLVASPSLGPGYGSLLDPLARYLGHSQMDASRFSQNHPWLEDLDKQFAHLKDSRTIQLFGRELVEDQFVTVRAFIGTEVVRPLSGAHPFGPPERVSESHHFSIAQPASKDATQQSQLLRCIADRPMRKSDRLPMEPELLKQLQRRLLECERHRVPFRTYHRLASLFEMPESYSAICFNKLGTSTAGEVKKWLNEQIRREDPAAPDARLKFRAVDDDEVFSRALSYAQGDRAEQVDERHYLLAILADGSSGTVEELTRSLTKQGIWDVWAAARSGRPVRNPTRSRVQQLIIKRSG